MRKLALNFFGAALLLASAGCIVDRQAARPDSDSADSQYAPTTPPPAPRAPARAPVNSKPTPLPAGAPPDSPGPQIAEDAKAADQDLDRESAAPGRPVITNLDDSGAPIPGTTGDAAPKDPQIIGAEPPAEGPPSEEEDMQGAPGANATADELNRAWPGAKPAINDDETAPPLPPAYPYTNPQAGAGQSEAGAEVSADGEEQVPPAGTEVDPASFHRPLRRYGRWVNTPDYGQVWIPYVDRDWQPYSDGAWTDTEYGWTFTSYDPWGWAVWHYGSWGFRAGIGWYWVPGRVWAPAWVSWRWGGGYACWRPIAPSGASGARWGNRGWVGVDAVHFGGPIHGALLARAQIGVAIARSQPLPGPSAHPVAGRAFGPSARAVWQATGRPVTATPATRVVSQAHLAARSAYAQSTRAGAMQSSAAGSRPSAMRSGAQANAERQQARAQNRAQRNAGPRPQGGRPGGSGHGGHHGGHKHK